MATSVSTPKRDAETLREIAGTISWDQPLTASVLRRIADDVERSVPLDEHERQLIRSALGRWTNEGVAELLAKL